MVNEFGRSDGYARHGIWEFRALLPSVGDADRVTLGEGSTPVIRLGSTTSDLLNDARVWAKGEHLNPTGSFKDRIAAIATSLAVFNRHRFILGTSSGNGGAAISAYGSRAGIPVIILASPKAAPAKLEQLSALGGSLVRVEGLGTGADVLDELIPQVLKICDAHEGTPFLAGFHYMPEAMTGVSTIWFEIEKQIPTSTVIYAPVGGGGLITGLHRGLVASSAPVRLVGVQPKGCATLARAVNGEPGRVSKVDTEVSGLQVAQLFDRDGAVQAIAQTDGHVVTVTDQEIFDAQRHLALSEGTLVEPAGAAALAGAISDARRGRLGKDDTVVIILSGAGLKDRTSLSRLATNSPRATTVERVESAVLRLLVELAINHR